jgi:taurine--2-oxoglutarate transaminase
MSSPAADLQRPPLGCAAGLACIGEYERLDILDNVQKTGTVLGQRLEEMKSTHACVGDVRYIGLFSAIELVRNKETREPIVPYGQDPEGVMPGINRQLAARGFMTYTHENMILVAPPLIITETQLREELVKLDEVLGLVDQKMHLLRDKRVEEVPHVC